MTPAARIQAAADVLDRVIDGTPAEQALTTWARRARFAGSGDRAVVRDHVFDALRCQRSFAALAGVAAPSGRALMIGRLRAEAIDPAEVFAGQPYGPSSLTAAEQAAMEAAPELATLGLGVQYDWPDWLVGPLVDATGPDATAVMAAQQRRAPVFLRANLRRTTPAAARDALAADGIEACLSDLSETALEVLGNARKIKQSRAFLGGLVELQDASSQAAVERLPLADGNNVLDYCAGGGGKSLATAARARLRLFAHDADPGRMRDLPARAARAGARIKTLSGAELSGRAFDLVLVDAPCSGSGTWRRTPDAKWRLTAARLAELQALQGAILTAAARHVLPGGYLAYMTCSLLTGENEQQCASFASASPGFRVLLHERFSPTTGGDGFFVAVLTRE